MQTNKDYLNMLENIVKNSSIGSNYAVVQGSSLVKWRNDVPIIFIKDLSEKQKFYLLQHCLVLMYTPSNEHFGIVPVEAMISSCPVIATNTGGLNETIRNDEVCGILCDDQIPNPFEKALERVLDDVKWSKEMGNSGRKRAIQEFSLTSMGRNLSRVVQK